jgi:hypothetical protein
MSKNAPQKACGISPNSFNQFSRMFLTPSDFHVLTLYPLIYILAQLWLSATGWTLPPRSITSGNAEDSVGDEPGRDPAPAGSGRQPAADARSGPAARSSNRGRS